jgi:hypothetical protein
MSGSLERKLKTALDESRLLILAAQVLFGFQFQAVFQELFENVRGDSQAIHCAGLAFMLLAIGWQHPLERDRGRRRLLPPCRHLVRLSILAVDREAGRPSPLRAGKPPWVIPLSAPQG